MNKHVFRFLGKPTSTKDQTWQIASTELPHMIKVLKLKSGDAIEVFDGNGLSCQGIIKQLSKSSGIVEAGNTNKKTLSAKQLTLLLGVLDFRKMDALIPQLVELGLDHLVLFNVEGQSHQRINDKTIDRWNKIILEACKQSKRSFLLKLDIAKSLETALQKTSDVQDKILLDPEGKSHLYKELQTCQSKTAILLGSEKGLSQPEVESALKQGFAKASLGPHILRSVTAASVATALFQA